MSRNTSSGFKLLAIRPLKGCNKKFLKVLKEGQVYQFYNDYEFKHEIENDIHSEIKEIKYTPSISTELYNTDSLNINISAVVGKNGSGKSSLFDLLFAGCYSIAVHLTIIKDENNSEEGQNTYPNTDLPLKTSEMIEQEIVAFNDIIDSIKLEIYYSIDDTYYRVIINGQTREQSSFTNNTWELKDDVSLSYFFYTIAINYSHYALNSQEIGEWIISLFHKNDGYKTPVVLNPMRTEGNININRERKLLTRRMIANFLEPISSNQNDSLRNIGNDKIAYELKCVFAYDFELLGDWFKINRTIDDIIRTYKVEEDSLLQTLSRKIWNILLESFFAKKHFLNDLEWAINKVTEDRNNNSVDFLLHLKNALKFYESRKSIPDVIKNALTEHFNVDFTVFSEYGLEFQDVSLEYIYSKLKRIAQNKAYDYVEFLTNNELNDVVGCNTENCINTFIGKLKNDNSHITFKIKGAIMYLKYFKELGIVFKEKEEIKIEISIQKLSDEIVKIINKEDFVVNTTMMVPPSYFKTDVLLNNGLTIEQLSSGEKQQIHCNSSIIYHLINLNSVQAKSDGAKKTKYQYANIYLDEIELYFHPEWQRSYLNNLLAMIKRINPANIKDIKAINICLATHSPYILSDIPTSNILFLKVENGVSIPQKVKMNTFGANIHDLLANSFFLANGFMGEFAKKKINSAIEYLQSTINNVKYLNTEKWDKDNVRLFIDSIGEPMLKRSINELYYQAFFTGNNNAIDEEIERLKKLRK